MPKQAHQPLAPKRLVQLFEGDREELERYHPKLAFSEIVRIVIHSHVKRLRETESRSMESTNVLPALDQLDLPLGDTISALAGDD